MKNWNTVSLPKWPGMLVVGKPITEEQAAEVIIRTSSFYFSTNDRDFQKALWRALDIKIDESPNWEGIDEAEHRYNVIPDIQYLGNYKIASCLIGDAQGWCHWNGQIGCGSFNIGKWPSVEHVQKEWLDIATAFPFLELQCQLLDSEICEDNHNPIIQFDLSNGWVSTYIPKDKTPITSLRDVGLADMNTSLLAMTMGDFNTERGCSIEKFKWALEICRRK